MKSADTSTPVVRSRQQLEQLLLRYGCSSFAVANHYDDGEAMVQFRIPDHKGSELFIPVQLVVRYGRVAEMLHAQLSPRSKKTVEDMQEQAERVAWRHLVLWVDATLTAVATGLQTASEAFLAQTLLDGKRVYDLFVEGGGVALLGPGPKGGHT